MEMKKKAVTLLLTGMMILSVLSGCGNSQQTAAEGGQQENPVQTVSANVTPEVESAADTKTEETENTVPKYIFFFIGDGMSYPQIQLTNYYLNAAAGNESVTVDGEEKNVLKSGNSLNMMNLEVTGSAQTYDSTSFAPDSASTATSIATGHKTWSGSINVSEDFSQEYETIAEKLKAQKGYKIGILSSVNLNHATPAAFSDTLALDDAVAKAVEFYEKHPDETLILVTGDHETGGLTIGYAGTDYDTFLTNFDNQKISYAKFDSDYVAAYKENRTDFETVMKDVTELFGLTAPADENAEKTEQKDSADLHPESEDTGALEMTAYDETMSRTGEESEFSQEEYILYGSYEPLTVTITHILNNKSGINFGSYAHTGLPVEVLVSGVGAEKFEGCYDNTQIYEKLAELTGVE